MVGFAQLQPLLQLLALALLFLALTRRYEMPTTARFLPAALRRASARWRPPGHARAAAHADPAHTAAADTAVGAAAATNITAAAAGAAAAGAAAAGAAATAAAAATDTAAADADAAAAAYRAAPSADPSVPAAWRRALCGGGERCAR